MDVSLRQWPLFATGLLLGAAGTMALGLHRPTQAELAAAAPPVVAQAAHAQAAPPPQAAPATDGAEHADALMQLATESFRAQEALAAANEPFAVAVAQPPKPRVRRGVKEADAETVAQLRPAISVMGAAPEVGEGSQPSE